MELLIKVIIFISLFCIGWYFGSRAEKKHIQQLLKDEAALSYIRLGSQRFEMRDQAGQLVMSSVVISHDYFKMVWASIHSFFGGQLKTYESLLDRARREAIVRLKKQAQQQGADEILALRIATSEMGQQGGMVEVVAYGTAIQAKSPIRPSVWPPQ